MLDEGYSLFFIASADLAGVSIALAECGELTQICRKFDALDSADLFLPIDWHNPIFDDGPAPRFVLQLCSRDVEMLGQLHREMANIQLANAGTLSSISRSGIFVARSWPVAGQAAPVERTAPVSFLVRYFSAMLPDADAFRAAYQASHPAILGRFPAIRNVRCYVPYGGHSTTSVELLNEVVFDSTDALVSALQSEVLQALREDTATLPERGDNAHHAMRRHPLLDE